MNLQVGLALILSAQLFVGMAASSVIGLATARGGMRMDQAAFNGNGTLFEGTTVETGRTASELRLNNGINVQLASGSKGTVYADRLVLQRGGSQLYSASEVRSNYQIEAKSLRVVPVGVGTEAAVQLTAANKVQVTAYSGNLRVTNAQGITIAALAAGRALEFELPAEAGASGPALVTGCVVKKDGKYLLTDEAAGVLVELRGNLDQYVGQRIEVTGSQVPDAKAAAGAMQVVQAGKIKQLEDKCSSKAGAIAAGAGAGAGAAAAGATAAGAAAGGATTAGTAAVGIGLAAKAVIAGVIVAAATTGTVVAVTGEEETAISK